SESPQLILASDDLETLVSGKYRLTATLGAGAMGIVYCAEQLDAEGKPLREVALKMMLPGLSRDPAFARRFLREIRIAAGLRNPYIVAVYDTGRCEDGRLFFTMELVRGPTIADLLRQDTKLPVGRAVAIAAQICDALTEAHSAREPIVHRDLK